MRKGFLFICLFIFLKAEIIYTQNLPDFDDIRENILEYLKLDTIYKNKIKDLTFFFCSLQIDNGFNLKLTKDDFGNYYYHFSYNDHEVIFFNKIDDNDFYLVYVIINISEDTPFYSFFPCHDISILEKYSFIPNSGIYYLDGFPTITYEIEPRHYFSLSFENNKLIRCDIHTLVD
jgi:hypothetical protein